MDIYLIKNGAQIGPFSEEQTKGMISAGMISHDDLAWIAGAAGWQPIRSILNLTQSPPPPLLPPIPTHEVQRTPISSPIVTQEPQPLSTVITSPTGVGGWLAFFSIALRFLGPIFSFAEMARTWDASHEINATLKSVMIVENIGVIVLLIYGFIVGQLIWDENKKGYIFAKWYLLIRLLGFIFVESISIIMICISDSTSSEDILRSTIGVIFLVIRELILFTVWWLYFKYSKRIKNTYNIENT